MQSSLRWLLTISVWVGTVGCNRTNDSDSKRTHPAVTGTIAIPSDIVSKEGIQSAAFETVLRGSIHLPVVLHAEVTPSYTPGRSRGGAQADLLILLSLPPRLARVVRRDDRLVLRVREHPAEPDFRLTGVIRDSVSAPGDPVIAVIVPSGQLARGAKVAVEIAPTDPARREALSAMSVRVLPASAILRDTLRDRSYVYVQIDSQLFAQRRIVVESSPSGDDSLHLILWEGVRPGERIVVAGLDRIHAIYSKAVLIDLDDPHPRKP